MQCSGQDREWQRSFVDSFSLKARQMRIPLAGGINLTDQCNLRCVHCYVPPPGESMKELDAGDIIPLLDGIIDAGCLYFYITGGEPLLRKDFMRIYRHARGHGLLVTVFSNGTLVDDDVIGCFGEFPPYSVEISLYGATEETYEKITRVKGSYGKCISGIERLVAANIRLYLKTPLMVHNVGEREALEKMAEHYNAGFRADASVFPRFDGDRGPVSCRVDPATVAEQEFSTPERRQQWKDYYQRMRPVPLEGRLFSCGAGLTNFHIDSRGNLLPCVMAPHYAYDLLRGSFQEGWQTAMKEIREREVSWGSCTDCNKRTLCDFCPAFFRLDTGCEETISDYLCELGNRRFHFIEKML